MVTLTEQIKCVKREIEKRKSFYPKWVAAGKLTQQEADYQIEAMTYVLGTLTAVQNFYRDFIAPNQKLL